MSERIVCSTQCEKCGHQWQPFGLQELVLPHTARVTCPQCNYQAEVTWVDEQTKIMLKRKELGLDEADNIAKKLSEFEKRLQLVEKQLELERQKSEITNGRIDEVKDWAKKREQDFKEIEQLAEEERDRERFQKDNK